MLHINNRSFASAFRKKIIEIIEFINFLTCRIANFYKFITVKFDRRSMKKWNKIKTDSWGKSTRIVTQFSRSHCALFNR